MSSRVPNFRRVRVASGDGTHERYPSFSLKKKSMFAFFPEPRQRWRADGDADRRLFWPHGSSPSCRRPKSEHRVFLSDEGRHIQQAGERSLSLRTSINIREGGKWEEAAQRSPLQPVLPHSCGRVHADAHAALKTFAPLRFFIANETVGVFLWGRSHSSRAEQWAEPRLRPVCRRHGPVGL